MAEQGRRDDAVARAERAILDELFEHYPAQLSKSELTSFVQSSRIDGGDLEDALAELLRQGLIHRQGDADFYWLTRPVIYITELGWSAETV